jgi:hypothetical protein
MEAVVLLKYSSVWRGGRVVEGARLESVYWGNSIAGSNPVLSAKRKESIKSMDSFLFLEEVCSCI